MNDHNQRVCLIHRSIRFLLMLCRILLFITLILQVTAGLSQVPEKAGEVPKAKLWVSPCEELCADLIAAIQRQPAMLEMRLEDALVMQEACAAELVSAAKYAVRDNPNQVSLILKTALKLAPQRTVAIRAALAYQRPILPEPVVQEEVRRAELPTGQTLQKKDKDRLAAELGDSSAPLEIRRAQLPDLRAEFEVRSAEVPSGPRLRLKTKQRR
jgi:hypothetical protein